MSVDDYGRDLAGIQALQRKQEDVEKDMSALFQQLQVLTALQDSYWLRQLLIFNSVIFIFIFRLCCLSDRSERYDNYSDNDHVLLTLYLICYCLFTLCT